MAQSSSSNFNSLQSSSSASPGIPRTTSQGNSGIPRTMSHNSSIGSASPRFSPWEPQRERGRSDTDHVLGNWQEDTTSCGLCGITIGKLSRHHCRICGLCVCASCSPSGFQVDGSNKVQRACAACVANAVRVPAVMQRLRQFSSKLFALSHERDPSRDAPPPTHNLLEAASRCEAALSPLEVLLVESHRRAERAEADVVVAGELAHQLQERLQLLTVDPETPTTKRDMPIPNLSGRKQRRRSTDLGKVSARSSSPMLRQSSSPAGQTLYATTHGHNSSSCNMIEPGKSTSGEGDSADDLRSFKTVIGKDWEENTASCSGCGAKFGWHRFKRWHHCRICGRCVCSDCSPSLICLEKGEKPVRVCTPCVADAPRVCAFANRVGELSARVVAFFGQEVSEKALRSEDLREMLRHCENALEPLEKMHVKIGPTNSECASSNSKSP